jgi:hypothetical protein
MARGTSLPDSQDHCLKVVASMVRVEIAEAGIIEAVAVMATEGSRAIKAHVVAKAAAVEEDKFIYDI